MREWIARIWAKVRPWIETAVLVAANFALGYCFGQYIAWPFFTQVVGPTVGFTGLSFSLFLLLTLGLSMLIGYSATMAYVRYSPAIGSWLRTAKAQIKLTASTLRHRYTTWRELRQQRRDLENLGYNFS